MGGEEGSTTECPRTYEDVSLERKFYVAQSEAFTVMLDHAVTASKICSGSRKSRKGGLSGGSFPVGGDDVSSYACSSESSKYGGRMYSVSDRLCRGEATRGGAFRHYRGGSPIDADGGGGAPCYISPNRTDADQDFFSLDVILAAAGLNSMDDCKDGPSATPCATHRDTGATVLLSIYWTDFAPFDGLVGPHYYYSPQIISGSSFKEYVPYYSKYRDRRTLLNAHGIKLSVLMGGEFRTFDPVHFLITLTTALGLMAVAGAVVDNLMLYVLPERGRYQRAKYETAEEFAGGIAESEERLGGRAGMSAAAAGPNRPVRGAVRGESGWFNVGGTAISPDGGSTSAIPMEAIGGSLEPLLRESCSSDDG